MWGLLALASAIWMAIDSSRIGYDKRDLDGFGAMGPVGWFFCGFFLWIVALPLYLVKRPTMIAAAQRRRLQMQQFAGALPGQVAPPYGAYPPSYPGAPGPYGAPSHPGPYAAAPGPYGGAPGSAPYGGAPPAYGAAPPPPGYGAPAAPPAPSPYGAPAPSAGPSPYGAGPPAAHRPGYPNPAPPPGPPSAAPAGGEAPGSAPNPSASSSMNAADLSDGIRQLTELRDRGLLTESEFQARKMQLLNRL